MGEGLEGRLAVGVGGEGARVEWGEREGELVQVGLFVGHAVVEDVDITMILH